jgi:hypothetical protein
MSLDGDWDERLSSHGIDAVLWCRENPTKITFIFKERVEGKRITIEEQLYSNKAGDEYRPVPGVSQELQDRGIKEVSSCKPANPSH